MFRLAILGSTRATPIALCDLYSGYNINLYPDFSYIADVMISLNLKSPSDVLRDVAHKARARRLALNLTQEGLAVRANVSLGTLKQFEKSGKASFETVLRIGFALDAASEFDQLFPPSPILSVADVLEKPTRQRGRRS